MISLNYAGSRKYENNFFIQSSLTFILRTYSTTRNFKKGTYIELANGTLRRVEDMRTEDFIQSAERSSHLRLAESTVVKINTTSLPNAVSITYSYDRHRAKVCTNTLISKPIYKILTKS